MHRAKSSLGLFTRAGKANAKLGHSKTPFLFPTTRLSVFHRPFHASPSTTQSSNSSNSNNPTPSSPSPPDPSSAQQPLYDESKQSDSWQYDPTKDPMLKMSPEELAKIKREIDSGARRAVNIGWVVGGGDGVVRY